MLRATRECSGEAERQRVKAKPQQVPDVPEGGAFLAYVVSGDGVRTDPAKVANVKDRPTPRCAKEVRFFERNFFICKPLFLCLD